MHPEVAVARALAGDRGRWTGGIDLDMVIGASERSMLALSALVRVGGVGIVLAILWLGVAWAVAVP